MTKNKDLASSGTKVLLLSGLMTALLGNSPRSQEVGDVPPAAPPHSAAETTAAKKVKPKPRVRHLVSTAVDDSNTDARPGSIKHICVIDRAAVDQQSAVNVASNRRLQDLGVSAQAQVDEARKKIDAQLQSNDGEMRQRPNDVGLKQRRQALAAQMQEIVNRAGLLSREYEATRQGVMRQLQSATMPIVQGVASSNGCSIVLARDTIVEPGDSLDISRFVIDRMNAQLRFRPFNLVDLANK